MLVIKRYPNRKLYDTEAKSYITLEQIAELIRGGQEIQVIDNVTGEDLSAVVLTQIILEQEKKQSGFVPRATLAGLVQSGGRTLSSLRQSLTNPQDLVHQIDSEIEQRIQRLILRGELAEEEARRWREKLLTNRSGEESPSIYFDPESLTRLLEERGVPSQEEVRRLTRQLDTLEVEINKLRTNANRWSEPDQSPQTGNFFPPEASNE